jgi:hypothetical protein
VPTKYDKLNLIKISGHFGGPEFLQGGSLYSDTVYRPTKTTSVRVHVTLVWGLGLRAPGEILVGTTYRGLGSPVRAELEFRDFFVRFLAIPEITSIHLRVPLGWLEMQGILWNPKCTVYSV